LLLKKSNRLADDLCVDAVPQIGDGAVSHVLNQPHAAKLAQRLEREEHEQGNGNHGPDVVNPVREKMVHVKRRSTEGHLE